MPDLQDMGPGKSFQELEKIDMQLSSGHIAAHSLLSLQNQRLLISSSSAKKFLRSKHTTQNKPPGHLSNTKIKLDTSSSFKAFPHRPNPFLIFKIYIELRLCMLLDGQKSMADLS